MGLFNFIGEKILDVAIASVDVLDKGFDKFSGTVDNILDKAEDVRLKTGHMIIDVECGIKNIASDIKYKQYDCIKGDIELLVDDITGTRIELSREVQELLKHMNSLMEQVDYVKNNYNISKETALRLIIKFRNK